MTNSTSTDVTFEGAWRNRVVAKQEDPHSTAPADKQMTEDTSNRPHKDINKDYNQSTPLVILSYDH